MATPIRETPILEGKDAARFERIIKENEKKPASQEEYNRVMSVYRSVRIVDKRDEGLRA